MVIIDDLRTHLEKVPMEHRCDVTLNLVAYDTPDSLEARATIGYKRPLTDEEMEANNQKAEVDIESRYQFLLTEAVRLKADAKERGVSLDELGLSMTDNYIELRRR